MTSTSVYRLATPFAYRVLVLGAMALFSFLGIVMAWRALFGLDGPPWPVVILWCGILLWNWHVLLGIPYEIRFDLSGCVSFVALGRTVTLLGTDMQSIRPEGIGGMYLLRHKGGKVRLLAQFTGFHEVVTRIKAANPEFETVGI